MRVGSTGALKAFAKAVAPLNEASDAYSGNLKRKSGYGKVVICASAYSHRGRRKKT